MNENQNQYLEKKKENEVMRKRVREQLRINIETYGFIHSLQTLIEEFQSTNTFGKEFPIYHYSFHDFMNYVSEIYLESKNQSNYVDICKNEVMEYTLQNEEYLPLLNFILEENLGENMYLAFKKNMIVNEVYQYYTPSELLHVFEKGFRVNIQELFIIQKMKKKELNELNKDEKKILQKYIQKQYRLNIDINKTIQQRNHEHSLSNARSQLRKHIDEKRRNKTQNNSSIETTNRVIENQTNYDNSIENEIKRRMELLSKK